MSVVRNSQTKITNKNGIEFMLTVTSETGKYFEYVSVPTSVRNFHYHDESSPGVKLSRARLDDRCMNEKAVSRFCFIKQPGEVARADSVVSILCSRVKEIATITK